MRSQLFRMRWHSGCEMLLRPSNGLFYSSTDCTRGNTLGTDTDTSHDQKDDFTGWERSILNTACRYGVDSSPMAVDCSPRAYNREGLGRTRSLVERRTSTKEPVSMV